MRNSLLRQRGYLGIGVRRALGQGSSLPTPSFWLPLADLGSGAVDTSPRGIGPATFTRATTATTVLSSGLIGSVASGTARSCYSPAGVYLGYLAEQASTNLLLQSADLATSWLPASSTVTANTTTSPDGTLAGDTLTATASATFAYARQTPSLTQSAVYTFSVFVKQGTSRYVYLLGETSADLFAIFDLQTASFSAYAGGSSASASTTIVTYPNSWYRLTFTFTKSTVTSAEEIGFGLTNSPTAASGSVSGQTGIFWGAQLEQLGFATSYIPTTVATVTRNADVLTYPTSGNVLGTVGSAYAEVYFPSGVPTSNNAILDLNAAKYALYVNGTPKAGVFDGTNIVNSVASVSGSTVVKLASAWGGVSMFLAKDGVDASGTFNGDFGVAANMTVVAATAPTCLKNLRLWTRALTSPQRTAITT